jgi:60 kDa SS-A/Ro ribonucleoprotein
MSKLNERKKSTSRGIIAGTKTDTAGKYSNYELLRRVTLANLLFESAYYQDADEIMDQIETLIPTVSGEEVIKLAEECRFEQKLRHTPLWLLVLANEYHGVSVKESLARITTRPDMLMDTLAMLKKRKGSIVPIPKSIKKGLAKAFDKYDEYQISKYKKNNLEISLVDVVNLVHPKPTKENAEALAKLVKGELAPPNTWEVRLSAGADKKETFERMIEEGSLGSLAILRNLRNMETSGVPRRTIKKALSQVKSKQLVPLNFLAAQRNAPTFTQDIEEAMKRSFNDYKLKGTTILAIDVSGSMGGITSTSSDFSRLDLAIALAVFGSFVLEDFLLVFTAGNDSKGEGAHMVWGGSNGFSLFQEMPKISRQVGHGGIFTYQLCEWLKVKGHASNADRLIVISDSQDIDMSRGSNKKPDLSPYKTSYIIDISTHTHGIKTGAWTAEISGWSDAIFKYIMAVEK